MVRVIDYRTRMETVFPIGGKSKLAPRPKMLPFDLDPDPPLETTTMESSAFGFMLESANGSLSKVLRI